MASSQIKIIADAKITDIVSSGRSARCDVDITNIQEYGNDSNLPTYLYLVVDYSDEIGVVEDGFLKNYDRNIALISNSSGYETRILQFDGGDLVRKQIPINYKNLYGLYKLNGDYYVKMYSLGDIENKFSTLLIYNGTHWVFYVQTYQFYKDILYINLPLKNDIANLNVSNFYFVDENKKLERNKNNYTLNFYTELPKTIPNLFENLSTLITSSGIIINNIYYIECLEVDTSKLISIPSFKITAQATISDDCSNIKIKDIQEYSNKSILPEYLYVFVDFSKEIAPDRAGDSLNKYDKNISLITNSNGYNTEILGEGKNIDYQYKNYYGVYKLVPFMDGKGSYYVKIYGIHSGLRNYKINTLLIYNGKSWVFYVQTEKVYKDFLYIDLFLKNDIKNYITNDFSFINENKVIQKNNKYNYKIFFMTELPPSIPVLADLGDKDNLIIGHSLLSNDYFIHHLNIDTSELITTSSS